MNRLLGWIKKILMSGVLICPTHPTKVFMNTPLYHSPSVHSFSLNHIQWSRSSICHQGTSRGSYGTRYDQQRPKWTSCRSHQGHMSPRQFPEWECKGNSLLWFAGIEIREKQIMGIDSLPIYSVQI